MNKAATHEEKILTKLTMVNRTKRTRQAIKMNLSAKSILAS
jgi:hypothetical protein